jgi:hypothetical protein
MRTPSASIRVLTAGAAAALALALGAPAAQAQVADCFQPDTMPERVFDAVDDEYPLDEFGDRSCGLTAKASAKGCKSVAKIAGGCRNVVNEALAELEVLICHVTSMGEDALKTCLATVKSDLKTDRADMKALVKQGSEGCVDDVPPAILTECAGSM